MPQRREAPFVGRVGLDRGIVGQELALVIHPFQLAVTGIQSRSEEHTSELQSR